MARYLFCLALLASLLAPAASFAQEAKPPEVKFDIEAADVIKANLDAVKGKPATLLLTSGQEISGVIAQVSEGAVHLTNLTGKEFFDAVVRLEDVSAISVRVRK